MKTRFNTKHDRIERLHQFLKVAFPLNKDARYQIFEYACHEGPRMRLPGVRRSERVTKPETRGEL
jgi:hypothetical protein